MTSSSSGGASGASSVEVGQEAGRRDVEGVPGRRGVPGGDAGERVEGGGRDAEDVGRRAGCSAAGDGGVDVGRGDLPGRGLAEHPGDAEVGQHRPPLGGEDDVARRQVAVDDAVLVGVREGRRHRRDGGHDLPGTQPATPGQQGGQASPGQQLEDEGHPGLPAAPRLVHHLDQADQVGMVELAEQGRLPRLPLRDRRPPGP